MSSSRIPLAILFGGIVIAFAVYASIPKVPKSAGNLSLVRPVASSDHILGNPAAPVIIVEYADFDCVECKGFHTTLHQLIANAGVNGKVAWVYRHFPLTAEHPNALAHARAAECAATVAGNDAFWQFTTALYAAQPADAARYGELASAAGITGTAFATCYAHVPEAIEERITLDRQNALDIGATEAPYSVLLVQGQPPLVIDSAYPYDIVKQLVDEVLAQ